MLCALRLTNIRFVQCFSLSSLNCEFVRLCVSFRYAYFASQTSGLCNACTSVLFGILHACVFMFCVLRLTNISFVQCFSLGSLLSLHAYIGHVLLCVFFDLQGFAALPVVFIPLDLLVSCIYFYVLIFADSLFLVLFASSLAFYCFLFYCCFSST